MRIIIAILMTLQLAVLAVPRIYGNDTLIGLNDNTTDNSSDNISDNTTDNTTDNITDNTTDNVTDNITDNITDNMTDNETEDNETIIRLHELFASVYDNYSCQNPTDPVIFPYNTNLEACVRQYTNANRWPMLCSDAENIRAIKCNDPEISSLDGLQQFPNLESLSFGLKGTKISDLAPIRNLTKMEILEIPYSEISEIGFLARMKNLRFLDLKGNHVTNLEFMPFLTGLEILYLEYQAPDYISDITHINPLVSMRVLNLQGNKITDITPISNMRNLAYLRIRDNRITDLTPVANLHHLSGIDFSINTISDITPLDNLTGLHSIIANNNRITDISPLDNLTALVDLQLLNNSISDVSPLANLKKLQRINLDYNVITDLTPLSGLIGSARLLELGLSYNCIPQENYRQIRYLNNIQTLRLDHQCENFPDNITSDSQYVVNSDLVGGKDILSENDIVLDKFDSTAGGGCSALPYGTVAYFDIAAMIFAVYILVKRKIKK